MVLHQDPNDTAQTIFVKAEKAVGFYLKGQMMPMEVNGYHKQVLFFQIQYYYLLEQ